MAKLSVSNWHPCSLTIDGTEVGLLVRRLSLDEFIRFERTYFDFSAPDRGVSVDTKGMSPEDAFLAVQAAAAAEPTEAERERVIAKSQALLKWVAESVTELAKFVDGEVDVDGVPVVTGEEILKVFGARQLLMMQIVNQIWAQNKLPEGIKKKLDSPSDFRDTSDESAPAAAGSSPEPTAESVDGEAIASSEDATPEPPPDEK